MAKTTKRVKPARAGGKAAPSPGKPEVIDRDPPRKHNPTPGIEIGTRGANWTSGTQTGHKI
jgi:hypothetical protein